MLNNVKVGTRLLTSFILIAVIGAVVAAIGALNMHAMNEQARIAYSNDLLGISASKEANVQLISTGRSLRNFLLSKPEARAQHAQRVAALRAATRAQLERARPLFFSAEAKALFADIDRSLPVYERAIDEIVKLAEDQTPQGQEVVNQHMFSKVIPAGNVIDDQFAQLAANKERSAQVRAEATEATYDSARALMIGLVLGCLGLSAAMGISITRNLTRQLGGEPGYATTVAGAIAAGDLASPVALRAGDSGSLLFAMESMRQALVRIVSEVRSGTDTIATASGQIASGNLDLSTRTEQQASSLEETASSMEQLTSTVRQNADNARQANTLASSASEVAARGGMVVTQVVDTMAAINESSRKIVEIISVIDGIAFQTNILALNAAVEAARAGEQGRGFAVVAAEVRNLAQRSANAAKEIKVLINDSVEKVEVGGKLVNQAGSTMDEVVGSITRVTDIMSEIAAASGEQTTGIEQVNAAIVQMDQVTQQNAALVEQASAAAAAMQDQAAGLQRLVAVFKLNQFHQQSGAPQRTPAARLAKAAPARAPRQARQLAHEDQWETV